MTFLLLYIYSLLQRDMVEQWKVLSGQSQEECAHAYLKAAQEWRFYGAALFEAEVSRTATDTVYVLLILY